MLWPSSTRCTDAAVVIIQKLSELRKFAEMKPKSVFVLPPAGLTNRGGIGLGASRLPAPALHSPGASRHRLASLAPIHNLSVMCWTCWLRQPIHVVISVGMTDRQLCKTAEITLVLKGFELSSPPAVLLHCIKCGHVSNSMMNCDCARFE